MEKMLPTLPEKSDDCGVWLEWCRTRLAAYASEISDNPMTNSVQRLSHDVANGMETGRVTLSMVTAMMSVIANEALVQRADRFRARQTPSGSLRENVEKAIKSLAEGRSFEQARQDLEHTRAGIVFTGHPTFAINRRLREDFIACVEADEGEAREKAQDILRRNRHRPDEPLTIQMEHEDVKAAIQCATQALDDINRQILQEAKKYYPSEWKELCPAPLSIATWVGYDLDGRTDIHWAQTLTFRLSEKAERLTAYSDMLRNIPGVEALPEAEEVAAQLSATAKLTENQVALFAGDLNDPDIVVRAANALTEEHPDRLIDLTPIIEKITTLINDAPDDDTAMQLCLLRAQMKAFGLGLARIHLRVNAAQVRSALRHDLGVQSDADFMGRSTLDVAAREAASVDCHQINFASVFLEEMTARRQFMLCAQILKHIDAQTPIRFLIAECEAPATVMGAVYLARAYNVEDKLDISPLFETPEALERGGRFLDRLLQEEEFCHYIRRRERIAIQLGFSDSGRFMGQIAADMAIERLHILLARSMEKHGVCDVEALVFNTNGESMGRGGFPGTMEDRLHHLITPRARFTYASAGIRVNAESSFQGGEGFLHFQTPTAAIKAMGEIFRVAFSDWSHPEEDEFYQDINFSWDVYRGIKDWQEDLFEQPDYTQTISSFGQKFLFTTGSRKTRRQRKGNADMSPRALRAIPHNAILQQMAIPANVACGIGGTVRQESDRFVVYAKKSDRMLRLTAMAEAARNLTSLPAFLSYANIYNATYWTRRATSTEDMEASATYQMIARQLADQNVYTALCRLGNHVAVDLAAFDDLLTGIHGKDKAAVRHQDRLNLHVLHALRQAAIMYALVLIARIPGFSGRHEVTQADLIDLVLHLQFDEVVSLLSEIFPVRRPEIETLSDIREATSLDLSEDSGYPEVHSDIVRPLQDIHAVILESGVAISHFYGAYG